MRLGFAISTSVQPDILLMDEWIGAGDEAFIARAKERMLSRFHGSRIVVLASHSTSLLRSMCNKALVLDRGRMRFFGEIGDGIEAYRQVVSNAGAEARRDAAVNDPLLFGNSVGLIERITITPTRVELEGWAIDEKGGEAAVVSVEAGGHRVSLTPERIDRRDVRLHLAKKTGNFGFRVEMPRSDNHEVADIVGNLKVSVGRSAESLGAPLPVAMAAIIDTH